MSEIISLYTSSQSNSPYKGMLQTEIELQIDSCDNLTNH